MLILAISFFNKNKLKNLSLELLKLDLLPNWILDFKTFKAKIMSFLSLGS